MLPHRICTIIPRYKNYTHSVCPPYIHNIPTVYELPPGHRYANSHPDTGRARGPDCRPLCPGVLQATHCLWKWHERPPTFNRGCWRARPWSRHRHLFGDTEEQQQKRKKLEARAWYDVIRSNDILAHANVTPDWDRTDAFLQSVMWC